MPESAGIGVENAQTIYGNIPAAFRVQDLLAHPETLPGKVMKRRAASRLKAPRVIIAAPYEYLSDRAPMRAGPMIPPA